MTAGDRFRRALHLQTALDDLEQAAGLRAIVCALAAVEAETLRAVIQRARQTAGASGELILALDQQRQEAESHAHAAR